MAVESPLSLPLPGSITCYGHFRVISISALERFTSKVPVLCGLKDQLFVRILNMAVKKLEVGRVLVKMTCFDLRRADTQTPTR